MTKRIISILLIVGLAVILVSTVSGAIVDTGSPEAGRPFPPVFAILSHEYQFPYWADEWSFFHISLVAPSTEALEARFIGARMGDLFVTGLDGEDWTNVIWVDHPPAENALKEYERLHNLYVEQIAQGAVAAKDTEVGYSAARRALFRIVLEGLKEQEPQEGGIIVAKIPPLPIPRGEGEVVELVFEARKKDDLTTTWQFIARTCIFNLAISHGVFPDPVEP